MPSFLYTPPIGANRVQQAAIGRGLRERFPDIEFRCKSAEDGFPAGVILPFSGHSDPVVPDAIVWDQPSLNLVKQVRAGFDLVLIEVMVTS